MKVRGLPYKNICLPEGFSFAAARAGIKASGRLIWRWSKPLRAQRRQPYSRKIAW
jgi:hypothetical protein